MAHVFVSYSRKDLKAAEQIVATLTMSGYEVWVDHKIRGGDLWKRSIVEAIGKAKAFIILLSPNAVTSDNVRKELDMADERHKLILPVVIAPTTIPPEFEYPLAGCQRIDLNADPPGDKRLLDALQFLRAVEEQDIGWDETEEEREAKREVLNSILADPTLSISEKINQYMRAHAQPSEGLKKWQKRWDQVQAAINANDAERDKLDKERDELMKEWETAKDRASRRDFEAVDARFLAMLKPLDAQGGSLWAEHVELMEQQASLFQEASRERDKIINQGRQALEESNKLIERIWK